MTTSLPTSARLPGQFHAQLDLELGQRAIYRLPDVANLVVRCTGGSVWLTLDKDRRDIVLQAGECFTSTKHRGAVLYALAPATVSVSAPAEAPATMPVALRPARSTTAPTASWPDCAQAA